MKKSWIKMIGIALLSTSIIITNLPINVMAHEQSLCSSSTIEQNNETGECNSTKSEEKINKTKTINSEEIITELEKSKSEEKINKESKKSNLEEKTTESNTMDSEKIINESEELNLEKTDNQLVKEKTIEDEELSKVKNELEVNEISELPTGIKDSTEITVDEKLLELVPINNVEKIKQNEYPIVLVHGFMGFGRDELFGYKYWGGVVDIEKKLNQAGYQTYTASVGPVSSNWDRACELYAYIVGGTVDYGEEHSKKYGHNRYGRTYEGEYKEISNENKIHLIGHSMGGQTIRTLTQLLSEGSKEEKEYNQDNLSLLFEGGNHWINSVTTISTPNDGTTLSDIMPSTELISSAFGVMGTVLGDDFTSLYNFKLDQWGLKKEEYESEYDYMKRVLDSGIWTESKDVGPYDLSTYGAKELNSWVKAQPDVYYFSWTTKATKKAMITEYAVPNIGEMNPLFYGTSTLIGRYERNKKGYPIIDKKWLANDGVVNCISQDGPKLGSNDIIRKYDGTAKIGQWNSMKTITNMDHMDIVGTVGDVEEWYINYAEQLSKLPK